MIRSSNKIRVFVVDDSKYMRYLIKKIIGESPEMEVVGEARDGVDALKQLETVTADVITLDVEMPRMDGLETLRNIMSRRPLPVLMVSRYTHEGGEIAIRALQSGAVDCVEKPKGRDALTMNTVKEELLAKIRMASEVTLEKLASADTPAGRRRVDVPGAAAPTRLKKVVVVGCSTGGPRALNAVLPALPPDLPAGYLIVQHMPAGFTTSLARRLDQESAISVTEAQKGDAVTPGKALVAPGDYHLHLADNGTVKLGREDRVNNVRPAVDVTIEDASRIYGKDIVCVILTGMGNDGTHGASLVRRCGGLTIVQSGDTCTVNGMPGSVQSAGLADRVVPLQDVAGEIISVI